MAIDKRLKKLEHQLVGQIITVRLKGGKTATLQSKRMLYVLVDVIDGKDTPETRVALAAEEADEDGNMIALMQAVARS